MASTRNGHKALHLAAGVGFTQVELLVVIGIIALLAAVLLPSVESTQRQGKSARTAAVQDGRINHVAVETSQASPTPGKNGAPALTDFRATISATIPVELVHGERRVDDPTYVDDSAADVVAGEIILTNDVCTNAISVGVPSSTFGTTEGATADSGFPRCLGNSGIPSPGVWYKVGGTGNTISATTCNARTTFDTQLTVYCPSCETPVCVAADDDFCGFPPGHSKVSWCSQLGQTYYILVHGFDEVEFGPFQLDVTDSGVPCSPPASCEPPPQCDVTCSPTQPRENEPNCGLPSDNVNGGCNSSPNLFTSISCGQSYCGTGAFDGQRRDTDWYKLVLAAPTTVTWKVEAEFDLLAGIVENRGIDTCEGVTSFRAFGLGPPCTSVSVTSDLPAGTWYLFVAPDFGPPGDPFPPFACGKEYTATVTCGGTTPQHCCLPSGACQPLSPAQCSASNGTAVEHCPTDGRCVPPGHDCFTTQCGRTLFDFCNDPIPADFFAPGSEPFTGIIILGGPNDGLPDTIVRRFDAMLLDGPPETVPIELLQLSLISCQPITVDVGTTPTQWNVKVDLSPNPVPPGSMMVAKKHPNGGVFDAQFHVLPRFTFTQVENTGNQRILDFGDTGRPPTLFETTDTPKWVHRVSTAIPLEPCGVNFVPGIEENPQTLEQCCTETCHANPAGGHNHCTKQCNICPRGACCDPKSNTCTITEGAAQCLGQYMGDGTNCNDSDGDGIADVFEINDCCQPSGPCRVASNPNNPDTDGDSVPDGEELSRGCDPCVPDCGVAACCLPLGACAVMSLEDCQEQGGVPAGSACRGDPDGDGIDNACAIPPCGECGPGEHWIDEPQCPVGDSNASGVCKATGSAPCFQDKDCSGVCRATGSAPCFQDKDCSGVCRATGSAPCFQDSDCSGVCQATGAGPCFQDSDCIGICQPSGGNSCSTNADCSIAGDSCSGRVCEGNICDGNNCDGNVCNKPNAIGQDNVPSGAVLGIDTNFDCIADTNVIAGGPVTVRKRGPFDDSQSYPGTRLVDGHKDVIDTEILAMSLTGGGVTLKAGTFSASNLPLRPTLGAIAEQGGNPSLADSFFDVFIEVDAGGGTFYYNQTPVRVAQVIECVPPHSAYYHITGCLPLYTSPVPGVGVHVANLVAANHMTFPACCATVFPGGCAPNTPVVKCQQAGGTTVPACLGDGNGNGQDDACEPRCEVDPGSATGCTDACPPPFPASAQCLPSAYGCIGEGQCGVIDCNCDCHLVFDAAGPSCQGNCPNPTDICPPAPLGDGSIGNPFRCDCRPRRVVEVDEFPNTTAQMSLQFPDGTSEDIDLSGPTTVHVFFEGPNEGDADDSNGNGRDDVETEIVDMQLTGVSPTFGPVLVRLHPTKPSRGVIEETANTLTGRLDLPPFAPAGTANSFFDVFFEVQAGGLVLHTQQPKRMRSVIRHKPPAPGDTYENPDKIPLLDANGDPTGFSIGAGKHTPRPVCGPNATGTACIPNTCPAPQTFVSLSKSEFEALMGGEGKFLKGIEDFEEAVVEPGFKFAFPEPLQGNVPNGPFPNGLSEKNLIIQTNITPGPSPAAPNPSGSDVALFVVGPGFVNSNSKKVGEDLEVLTGTEASLDLIFTEPNHTGVGFELSHFEGFGQGTWTITVYDKADNIIGVYTLPSALEPNKNFFGVWSPRTIGRINIYDEGIIPDAIDNIQMWVGEGPIRECLPKCAKYDPETGGTRITDCDCVGLDECHMQVAPAVPTAGAGTACVVPDNGSGTVTLPPAGCGYLSPEDVHTIIDGLPPGTTIELGAEHSRFNLLGTTPGGPLGGEVEVFGSFLHLQMNGTGELAGFSRKLQVQMDCETHVGPRMPGDPVQSFDTDMFMLQGQLPPGDPDFELLRITGGTGFGLPSPGHTTLTQLPGGDWAVDSFFDITYRIDFVGAPGGPLGGMSGSTTGTIRMQTTPPFKCVGGCPPDQICVEKRTVNPDGSLTVCCDCRLPCGSDLAGDCFEPHSAPSCNNGECCECVCAVLPTCCSVGWSQECAELAREICVQPTVVKWESVLTHLQGVGDVGLTIPDGGGFSEPRSAVRKIVVTFDRPIDPATAVPENVNICGRKPDGSSVDLSGVTMAVTTTDGDTKMVVTFAPGLPDFARYHMTLKGLHGRCKGPVKPGTGGLSRIFTALQYDANGDLRVTATDLGLIRSLVGTNPIIPAILNHVRSDGNNDGRITATDLGGARARIGNDTRAITDPVCP